MINKIWYYVAVVVILLVLGYWLGSEFATLIGIVLVFLGLRKSNKDKLKDAQDNIKEAGEDIEAKKHDSNSALDFFNDFFSKRNGK